MSSEKETEFSLPTLPYFYHDITARLIPGTILIGLIATLAIWNSTGQHSVGMQHLQPKAIALFNSSELGTGLLLLAAAYFVGVFFEGAMFRVYGPSRFDQEFSAHCSKVRKRNGISSPMKDDSLGRLAEQASAIVEGYEPLIPHYSARAVRFNGESKMMLHTAYAIPLAYLIVGLTTWRWAVPGGIAGFMLSVLMVPCCIHISSNRQGRRAVETMRSIEYLAKHGATGGAYDRSKMVWDEILREDIVAPPPAMNPS